MIVQAYGNNALIVKYEGGINKLNLSTIRTVVSQLQTIYSKGIRDIIPAYDSIVIKFHPQQVNFDTLERSISEYSLINQDYKPTRRLAIPICFDDEFALDKERLELHLDKSFELIVKAFVNMDYDVHMMGFLPGFGYMASVPVDLHCPRLPSPRKRIPAGSLAIAGEQTAIYPSDSPGGWNIMGHCPLEMFDIDRDNWSLLESQDRVRFNIISKEEHIAISQEVRDKSFDYGQIIVDES